MTDAIGSRLRENAAEWWDDDTASTVEDDNPEDPLETLRARYARGELTDEAFERKLDRLLETEVIEAAQSAGSGVSGARLPPSVYSQSEPSPTP